MVAVVLYLHFCGSVGEGAAKQLRVYILKAFVDCFDKQVFPPDTVERLRVIKERQDGLL